MARREGQAPPGSMGIIYHPIPFPIIQTYYIPHTVYPLDSRVSQRKAMCTSVDDDEQLDMGATSNTTQGTVQ